MFGLPTQAPSSPIDPRLLVTFTMRPAGDLRSRGMKAFVTVTTAKTFVSYTARMLSAISSIGSLNVEPGAAPMPALFTSTSRWPVCAAIACCAEFTDAASVTSSATKCTSPSALRSFAVCSPFTASRAPRKTVNPSRASPCAIALPIPLLAPVTRAIFIGVDMSTKLDQYRLSCQPESDTLLLCPPNCFLQKSFGSGTRSRSWAMM